MSEENLKLRSTGNLPFIKEMNRGIILEKIRSESPISRAEIAKQTGLHPSTVTRIVASLIKDGIVEEKAPVDHPKVVGRTPIMLNLVADSMHAIGVAVETTYIQGLIVNVNGDVVERLERPWTDTDQQTILNGIKEVIDQLLEKADERGLKILGVGIGMHGIIDSVRGICLFAPGFGWKNTPIIDELSQYYDLPVRIENNANTMALGERWFNNGRDVVSLTTIKIDQAIGAGIILNGSLFVGEDFSAGEIGHFTVSLDGPLCNCGNYGCLETVASIKGIVDRGKHLLNQGATSELAKLVEGKPDKLSFFHICEAVALGDELTLQLLAEAGSYLGVAIANLLNILNPKEVLIGGRIYPVLDYVLPKIREVVEQRSLEIPHTGVNIGPVTLGDDAVAIGATTLIFGDVFLWSI